MFAKLNGRKTILGRTQMSGTLARSLRPQNDFFIVNKEHHYDYLILYTNWYHLYLVLTLIPSYPVNKL